MRSTATGNRQKGGTYLQDQLEIELSQRDPGIYGSDNSDFIQQPVGNRYL